MKVLGLLQNTWAYNPARVQADLDRVNPQTRRRLIGSMLSRSFTGKRLRAAFGHWCDVIEWENASPVVVGKSRDCSPADLAHVHAVVQDVQPSVILVFGKEAAFAIDRLGAEIAVMDLIIGPHPAGRGSHVTTKLAAMRVRLDAL